jgi:hypothetical protein
MNPAQFAAKWKRANLKERSASQEHFIDLCDMLGQPRPAEADPEGTEFTFERGVRKTGGGDGWADVWKRGHFGWEYKGKHKDLDEALRQLVLYSGDLENPPLLIVCDLERFEVHTNFTNTVGRVYRFNLDTLPQPENLDVLRRAFQDPQSLRPGQTTAGVTEEAARVFTGVAEGIRARGVPASDAAHFLMKIIFCLFAEDIGLLRAGMFSDMLVNGRRDPPRLARQLRDLFKAMTKGGEFGPETIEHFNGGLFADSKVIDLTADEIAVLVDVSRFAWDRVEPSIFGTLFERLLDPDKRTQIGAHYTSREDILTIVEPVLMAPLRREWSEVRARCETLTGEAKASSAAAARTRKTKARDRLLEDFLARLSQVHVLDPACGSGNFLYVALQLILDLEKQVIAYAYARQVGLLPQATPTQLHGIEISPYARELAQVVVWIGYLQWKRDNAFPITRNPVLAPVESIRLMDAILDRSSPSLPVRPEWPDAFAIVGNPPFLGGKMLRTNLGGEYVDDLYRAWEGLVPQEADLCCYWFVKAREHVERGRAKRVGLLATQGIRSGANREVLKAIKRTGDIFFAVSDREWVLDGANVHVSMIGFDGGLERERLLDGHTVLSIHADLTAGLDLTAARRLRENKRLCFQGDKKVGRFEIDETTARAMLGSPNPHGRPNSEVVRPWLNGVMVLRDRRRHFIVDFPPTTGIDDAACYERPFEHIRRLVQPVRAKNRRSSRAERWWIHGDPQKAMREAVRPLRRFLVTPSLSKHRVFVWVDRGTLADAQLMVFAREDDFFFGVLHSSIHERWARRLGSQLREAESGFRYTPRSCFDTFPFPPAAGGIAGTSMARSEAVHRERISRSVQRLVELRDGWLNPLTSSGRPALSDADLRARTLTNLYNERPTWLEKAHEDLDRAVLAAYGWPEEWAEGLKPRRDENRKVNPLLGVEDPMIEREVLTRLLALNQEFAGAEGA